MSALGRLIASFEYRRAVQRRLDRIRDERVNHFHSAPFEAPPSVSGAEPGGLRSDAPSQLSPVRA